jgi:DNA polymerase III alpha subunit
MLFVTMEDFMSQTELLIFPKTYAEKPEFWTEGKIIIVQGKVSTKDAAIKVLVNKYDEFNPQLIEDYEKWTSVERKTGFWNKNQNENNGNMGSVSKPIQEKSVSNETEEGSFPEKVIISLGANIDIDKFNRIKRVLYKYEGKSSLIIGLDDGNGNQRKILTSFKINICEELKSELIMILGYQPKIEAQS